MELPLLGAPSVLWQTTETSPGRPHLESSRFVSAAPVPGFLVPLGLDEPCAAEAFWGKLPAAMFSFGFHGALRPLAQANARHKRFHTDAPVQRLCLLLYEPPWLSCAVLPDSHKAPTVLSSSIGAPKKQIGGSGLLALCSPCQDVRGEACHSGARTLGLCVVPTCSACGPVLDWSCTIFHSYHPAASAKYLQRSLWGKSRS